MLYYSRTRSNGCPLSVGNALSCAFGILQALFLCVALTGPAFAAKRVALVIGIGDYDSLPKLGNPVLDAKAIAAVLRANGFEVSEYADLTRSDLLDVVEDFRSKAETASVALVYYAGHGMELEGRNILAPRDMEIDCQNESSRRSVSLTELFASLSGAEHGIAILDACRNNPFPSCKRGSNSRGFNFREIVVEAKRAGQTQLIANSTLSDKLAEDGSPGEHSPFAKALLARMASEPSVILRDVLESVALDVNIATSGSQVPEIRAIGGPTRVCLSESSCGNQGVNPSPTPPSSLPTVSFDPALEAWTAAKASKSTSVLQLLIAQFPTTVYAELARERLEELREIPSISTSENANPSFSCARATLTAEVAICESPSLASLDLQLAKAYAEAVLSSKSRHVRGQQRSWLDRRNRCGSDTACLEKLYTEQIGLFESIPQQHSQSGEVRPSFSCAESALAAEFAICNSHLLANLDRQLSELYASTKQRGRSKFYIKKQRTWLDRRNACGSDVSCLERRYQEQIAFLQNAQ